MYLRTASTRANACCTAKRVRWFVEEAHTKILAAVLLVVGLVVVSLLFIASRRSDDFVVERSTKIGAPREVVFAHINDFHAWNAWSPWAKLDPGMQTQFDGPSAGVGAGYRWAGNKKVGEGSMRVTEAVAGPAFPTSSQSRGHV